MNQARIFSRPLVLAISFALLLSGSEISAAPEEGPIPTDAAIVPLAIERKGQSLDIPRGGIEKPS